MMMSDMRLDKVIWCVMAIYIGLTANIIRASMCTAGSFQRVPAGMTCHVYSRSSIVMNCYEQI